MIDVRLRDHDSTQALTLGRLPFDQLDNILPTIRRWGLEVDGKQADHARMWAQFVLDSEAGAAYFEVVIEEPPE